MRAGWKHHRIQTKLTRRFIPNDIHFYNHIWGLHFSLFLLRLKCFWIRGWTICFPCQTSWNGICLLQTGGQAITERALPGCRPLDTQRCDGTAPGYISDPVASQSGGPHWQPQVVTASVSWCGVPLADKGEQESMLLYVTFVRKEETSGPGWLWNNKMAAPVIRVLALLPSFQGGPGLGKEILAFSDCTHYLMCPPALIICIRSRFHKPFSCETRLVIRVNYSVVRGNIMIKKK